MTTRILIPVDQIYFDALRARVKALEATVAELERQVNTLRCVVGTDKIVPLRAYYEPTDEDPYGWGGQG